MTCIKRSICILLAGPMFLSIGSLNIGSLNAHETDHASGHLARAQTAKQQCINICRARYRDCRHLNQRPSFECRGVYQDCTRYTCTGSGPG